ncbi:MAG: hypothetical protein GW906_07340 [Epsilonproteobacteria bacterium]|nr:hypothetical protein [Campylobacterota bacterium]OIO17062.1 MAG: hypothetical protein AUJ81_02925 [Helicobacteraceae bacterium CG1_02_36_14]PIP09226.1 MAG: hypothetical protein COX50_12075 [Sulfurimonas sp. CG23_combo_of_CG06-09_8_20_14_all_36_33]PIS24639.1 MAG: hypothetical protein COT46_08695 [Sulfurimonas sp. CG08_land_8_20_14_0_20_36_33]PIU34988.1 MAG: hypothetical protein COT05_05355 [Sulfurimonas sp. CG07_land_8_20_14_0_80_36_56]PIV02968.1 MAG: hypothetical protein COS56_10220 [Sulfur
MRKHSTSMKSKFTSIENQFLNTFFSGLYISANEFISVGAKVGLKLTMNSRELLIKELLNKSDENGTLSQTTALLNTLIQERVARYHALSLDYPSSAGALSRLAQKASSTKSLLSRESQGNPYE